jgi:glycosyltransferase involved in cell wall biosynthesis
VAFHLAVDALNLVADRRGMGRSTRRILGDWIDAAEVEITLMVRDSAHVATLSAEYPFAVRTLGDARQLRFDAVWYPWNGIRFEPDARKVVTFHDVFAFTQPHANPIARWREQRPIRRAIRIADAFTTVSGWSARELARTFDLDIDRFEVLPPICDDFWKPIAVEPAAQPYVLLVGGPNKRKNVGMLVEAFGRAFPARDVTLVVAGTLSEADEALLARAPLRHHRVRPNDVELRGLYAGAWAVAIPSFAEGYGVMALEAMSCGAPVVASDAAALPEACDGAALLVPPFDVELWRNALARVVSDDALRAQLRAQSLERGARIDRTAPSHLMLALLRQ